MFGRSRRVTIGIAVLTLLAVLGVAWAVLAPRVVLERAKDPGLGVRDLHAPDLRATELAGLLAEGAVHGPGLIAPARVVELAPAWGREP